MFVAQRGDNKTTGKDHSFKSLWYVKSVNGIFV